MTAPNLVSIVVSEYLAPALRADGWRRTGASFRWLNDAGDQAVIGMRRRQSPEPDTGSFYVDVALWTEAYIDLSRAAKDLGTNPHAERGIFTAHIRQPDTGRQWWDVTAGTLASCGQQLVDVVAREVAPAMIELLDRDKLLSLRRSDTTPPGPQWQAFDPIGVMLAFLVDDGPSEEVEELVRRMQKYREGPLVEAWVRQRLASRTIEGMGGTRREASTD